MAATYVLIHGAGDVGWYWHLVEPELVHRLPVGDVVLGLKSRNHRRRRAQRPQHESPERGDPQPFPPSGRGEQIEEHGADQQRRGQIVERRVEPGPVVAGHRVS